MTWQERPDASATTSLRASLLTPASPAPPGAPATVAEARSTSAVLPTAPELLTSSPNLQRLCESYHRAHVMMVERSRRQRIGIALLVAAVAVTGGYLKASGVLTPGATTDLVLAVAGVSCVGLAAMAKMWMRDDRRLRNTQGERLLRALQFNCDLPRDRIEAVRSGSLEPTRLFFDCYAIWRAQHNPIRNGIAGLLGTRV